MVQTLLTFHHYWGMLTLTMTLVLTVVAFIYYIQGRSISSQVKRIGFLTVLTVHVQVLAGICLLITRIMENPEISANLMTNAYRPTYIEHPTAAIIAAVLVTIANAKLKRIPKVTFGVMLMVAIALAILIGRIPAAFWTKLFI